MSEFPSYRPIQQFVIDNLNLKRKQIYTSRLNAWIRVTGNAGGSTINSGSSTNFNMGRLTNGNATAFTVRVAASH